MLCCVLCLNYLFLELSECESMYLIPTGCILVTNDGISCGSSIPTTSTSTAGIVPPPLALPQSAVNTDNVLPPVQIFSPNMKFTVQTGESFSFPCNVGNLASNILLWRHGKDILGGIPDIPLRDERRYRLLDDYSLEIFNAIPEDQGTFECLITTTRPKLSVVYTLDVLDPPTLNIFPDTGFVVVNEGDSVTVGCIPKGNPLPQVSWSKRDGIIPLHQNLYGGTHLRLQNVSREDAGIYICKADNQIGEHASGSIYIRVHYMPKVTTPEPIIYTALKYRTIISCNVDSDPQAEVQWLFQGKRINYSGRIYAEMNEKEHQLIFNSVRLSDYGTYTCISVNPVGYDLGYVEVTDSAHGQSDRVSTRETEFVIIVVASIAFQYASFNTHDCLLHF